MHTPFGKVQYKSQAAAPSALEEATLRDFSGGLNLVDNDVAIRSNYAKVLDNWHRDADGGNSIRFGTMYKWTVSPTVTGNIIEMYAFNDRLVVFTSTGQVCTVDETTGTVVAIWSSAIAALLPGTPAGWSSGLASIDITEFKGELVVCNGVDKPILISSTFTVTYLQDIATGSNVFVPVGYFVTTVSDYTVIAGVNATPFEVHISAKGTSGTWAGDPDPNDAVSINIGAYAPAAGGPIRGISSFRNFLLVHFKKQTVPVELGVYDEDGNHTPKPNDVLGDYGILSHRMGVALTADYVFADERGVQKAIRNQFGGALEGSILAEKIIPRYAGDTPDTSADRFKSFAVYNKLESRIMFFIHKSSEYNIYVLSYDKDLKRPSWSIFNGWDFTCGCLSDKGRVYFAKGTKIFQYGNDVFPNEAFDADEIGNFDSAWLTATAYVVGDRVEEDDIVYIALQDHTSGVFADDLEADLWVEYLGDPITFDWELPWSDINTRMKKKRVSILGMDTTGTARFTISVFADNAYKDANGDYDPMLTMDFVAGTSPGYGGGNQPYGGGRRAIDERLWGFPLEFKIFKLRVHGSSIGRLKFSTLTILYKRGKYHR